MEYRTAPDDEVNADSRAACRKDLQADRTEIGRFVRTVFSGATVGSFVSLRAFYDDKRPLLTPFTTVMVDEGEAWLEVLIGEAARHAEMAANSRRVCVFCPPPCTFVAGAKARKCDIADGLALVVECDQHPQTALARLRGAFGEPNLIVASGGVWTDPDTTADPQDKLHLYYVLNEPTRSDADHKRLELIRAFACRLVGADPSGVPINHPMRWPGSWHTKGKPVLCRIIGGDETRRITLAEAEERIAACVDSAPRVARARADAPAPIVGRGDDVLIKQILSGEAYRTPLRNLAHRCASDGMERGRIIRHLQGLMDSVPDAVRDLVGDSRRPGRWAERRAEIPRHVHTAPEKSRAVAPASNLNAVAGGDDVNGDARALIAHVESAVAAPTTSCAWRDVGATGKPRATYPNARTALLSCGLEFSFDRFADRGLVRGVPFGAGADGFTDKTVSILRQHVLERHGFDPGKENVFDAALQLCHEHSFDPVEDYLSGLTWDGRPRLDTWLHRYIGAEDTPLHRAFGANVLIAAARRARQPGCKFDFVLVLEGLTQGEGKSTALRILAGKEAHFTDQEVLHLGVREQQEAIAGKWIVELSELAGIGRGEIERIKAFVSRTHDRARPAYGRITVDQPRRCVFIGTTNQGQYLRDATGNRRFWPVRVGAIDLAALREDRDQLWAEAAASEAAGHSLVLPKELWVPAAEAQSARMEDEPWIEKLASLRGEVNDGEERIAFRDVVGVLSITTERQSTAVAKRIGDCMLQLGWAKPEKPFKLNGKSTRGYTRTVRDVTAMSPSKPKPTNTVTPVTPVTSD